MIDFTTVEGARSAFRQLYNQVQSIFNWDIQGKRLQNVGDGVNAGDAINKSQLDAAIGPTQTNATSNGLFQTINSLIISKALKLKWLTVSLPLKIDSTGNVISAKISLAGAVEVTGLLPHANGGSGVIGGAAQLPQTIDGTNFNYAGTTGTILGGSQSVTVTGSSFTAPAGGGACSGSFSFTINGTNFTVNVPPAVLSGSQALD